MPDEDLQPQTAFESAEIERFASVGGDAPLSPKMGGPTVPLEPVIDVPVEVGETVIVMLGSMP